MKRFSSIKPEEKVSSVNKNNVLFENEDIKIVNFEDTPIVTGKDRIYVLPYFIEQNKIILRQENIPSYKYNNKEQDIFVSLVGGGIEEGENPETALRRELQEEAGIVLRANYPINIGKPLYTNKACSFKYYLYILNLTESDYNEVAIDKSKEHPNDKSVKIDCKYINTIKSSDLMVELMVEKFKRHINL